MMVEEHVILMMIMRRTGWIENEVGAATGLAVAKINILKISHKMTILPEIDRNYIFHKFPT